MGGVMAQRDEDGVLQKIMENGTFDELRKKVLNELKQNENLRGFAEAAVLKSKALNAPNAEHLGKKELFDQVRRELEQEVLSKALKTTWEVLTAENQPIPTEIQDTVHEALCAVHEQREVERRQRAQIHAMVREDYA